MRTNSFTGTAALKSTLLLCSGEDQRPPLFCLWRHFLYCSGSGQCEHGTTNSQMKTHSRPARKHPMRPKPVRQPRQSHPKERSNGALGKGTMFGRSCLIASLCLRGCLQLVRRIGCSVNRISAGRSFHGRLPQSKRPFAVYDRGEGGRTQQHCARELQRGWVMIPRDGSLLDSTYKYSIVSFKINVYRLHSLPC